MILDVRSALVCLRRGGGWMEARRGWREGVSLSRRDSFLCLFGLVEVHNEY